MIQLHALDPHRLDFPPVDQALTEPDGLLAFGGDLSPERLIRAYRTGIFPWYEADQPILWWSPDPRTVIVPDQVHISRSMKKLLAKQPFDITFNRAFDQVMRACAAPRSGARGTWITNEMLCAYNNLHRLGFAHSVEVWQQQQLVGGLYGIALGRVFFGESMFSRVANASKAGFITLAQRLNTKGFKLIDCQVASDHLFTLGARQIPRTEFVEWLGRYIDEPQPLAADTWR